MVYFVSNAASVFCTPTRGRKTRMEMENQTHNRSQDPSVVEYPKLSSWSRWVQCSKNSSQSLNDPEYTPRTWYVKMHNRVGINTAKHYLLALVHRNQVRCAQKTFMVVHMRTFIRWNLIVGHRTPQNKTKRQTHQCRNLSQRGCSFHCHKGWKWESYITNAWFRLCWQKGHHFFQKRMENLGSSVFKCSFFGAPFVAITDYEGIQCLFNPILVRFFHSQMAENTIELV